MSRRILIAIAGCWVFVIVGPPAHPRQDAAPSGPLTRLVRSPLSETTLQALERENGCLDSPTPAPSAVQSWPDWASAHIAGGDVPPARVVSDPYPTLHSVVVDPA